jgi:ABC-type lipoprotein release transport system permease subunit
MGGQGPPEPAGRGRGGAAIAVFLVTAWRRRWRALVVLAVVVGLTGGVGFAAAAGARRSASALVRFGAAAQTLDVFLSSDVEDPPGLGALLDGPLVEEHLDLSFVFVDVDATGFFFAASDPGGEQIERGVLLDGRRADPDEPDEVVLNETAARRYDLGVGDTWEVGTISPDQVEALFQGIEPTELGGPRLELRVVGIARNGFDIGIRPNDSAVTLLPPAFLERYGGEVGVGTQSHLVRLADGRDGIDAFTDAVADVYTGQGLPSITVGQQESAVGDSISVVTAAILVAGAVIVIAGLVLVVTAAARHQRAVLADVDVLRAFGATRADRRLLLFGTVLPAVVGGTVLAAVVAIALSPALPVGVARRLDPDPGLHADAVVLLAGTAVLVLLLGVAVAISAARLTPPASGAGAAPVRVPRVVDRAARDLAPAAATGVRFALFAPRSLAAPVRPALLGAVVGVVGLVAVAVVGTSLHRLVDTPARWGTTWDVAIEIQAADALDRDRVVDNPDIAAAAVGLFDDQVVVDGHETIVLVVDPVKGAIEPAMVEGRAPRADDEVVVGRDTLDAIGGGIGDEVTITSRSEREEGFTIVGVAAFPTVLEPSPIADGAAFTAEGGERLLLGDPERDDAGFRSLLVRWVPGVDEDAALARLEGFAQQVDRPEAPPEIVGLDDVALFPMVAAGALVVLGSIATTHALIVTVRRRRLELAVLSALGFAPRQRRTVIVVQAMTVALVALVVGVPLGAVVGRVLWSAIAGAMGVAPDVVWPFALLALGAAGLVVALNLVATLPAVSAARLRIAEALRSE